MADNLDEVFGADHAAEMQPEPELVPEPAPAPEPVEPAPEVEVEAVAPEQEAPVVEEGKRETVVPLSALHGERDRRLAAEERARQLEAQTRIQPQAAPDPYDDPEGFRETLRSELRMEFSETQARAQHGDEAVDAASAWAHERVAAGDPSVAIAFSRQRNPVQWLVQQHQREALLKDIGDRPLDEFVREYVTKNPAVIQSAPVAVASVAAKPQQASPARVPRSLASQGSGPSDVRDTATGPLAGVDALFE